MSKEALNIRKFLIGWSKRRNLVGYPLLLAAYTLMVRLLGVRDANNFFGHLVTAAVVGVPLALFLLHWLVSLIESAVMRRRGYSFDNGLFNGTGLPFWRNKNFSRPDKYVLVVIDKRSDPSLG